jgi:hypothetical protein
MKMPNFDICIPSRPRTMLEQIREAFQNSKKTWILLLDDDLILTPETKRKLSDPNFNFNSCYDIVLFKWENIEGKIGRQSGFYRVRAIRKYILTKKLPSTGVDIILESVFPSFHTEEFSYTHPLKNTFSAYMRWGKGRAYCLRVVSTKSTFFHTPLNIRRLNLYIAYAVGFVIGLFQPMTDNVWNTNR